MVGSSEIQQLKRDTAWRGSGVRRPYAGGGAPPNCSGVAKSADVSDGGGGILVSPNIHLLFWGSHWNGNPTVSSATVSDAFDRLARSSYLTQLTQYRGAGDGGRVGTTATIAHAMTNDNVSSRADPGSQFQSSEIPDLIFNAVVSGFLPTPQNNVAYCVVLPEGTINQDSNGGFWGEHGFNAYPFVKPGGVVVTVLPIVWLWVTHSGNLDELTWIFSHELAEACSDTGQSPGGITVSNWQPSSATSGTGSEIGDICEGFSCIVNGITMQSYYSGADTACVVPTFAWAEMSGLASDAFTVGVNADGRLEIFALGPPGSLHHAWQNAPSGGWSSWNDLGALTSRTYSRAPAVGRNADGRLEAFVSYQTGVAHIAQTAANGGWGSWGDLGVLPHQAAGIVDVAANPVVAANADGRLELFVCGSDGAIYHQWQTAPSGSSWSGWNALGTPQRLAGPFALGQNQDGRLEVFALDLSGNVMHVWQTVRNGGWSSWSSLGQPSARLGPGLAVQRNADGRLELFAAGANGALWHLWQMQPNAGWSSWDTLGRPTALTTLSTSVTVYPAAAANADGRIEVFALDANLRVWHRWQTAPSGGPWSDWRPLSGGAFDDALRAAPPVAAENADGRLELFASRGSDKAIGHVWQTSPNGQWILTQQTSGCP